jgi:O-antigen/teichoic acid export membrane protein
VIAVFAVVRWITGIVGFRMVCAEIGPLDWRRPFAELYALRTVVPRLAGVMICALALRSAALVILPSLSDTTQAGLFAVSYQLADLAMLVPTVLALSSTFVMSRGASYSRPRLRRTMVAMVAVLSVVLFPVAGLAIALAAPTLEMLFGPRMLAAAPTLQLLMLATPLMAVDQVLSQGMVSMQRYSEDLIAISLGAAATVVLTVVLGKHWGAPGAAAAFFASMSISMLARVWLMRDLRITRVFIHAAWRAGAAAVSSGLLIWWGAANMLPLADQRWQLLWVIPGVFAYVTVLVVLGGARTRSRHRMAKFVSHREA